MVNYVRKISKTIKDNHNLFFCIVSDIMEAAMGRMRFKRKNRYDVIITTGVKTIEIGKAVILALLAIRLHTLAHRQTATPGFRL